jgi:mRNA-degrading endonuclease toxin of MazEF toxin-antitoxin module
MSETKKKRYQEKSQKVDLHPKTFTRGDIYLMQDEKAFFPGRILRKLKKGKTPKQRPVIILQSTRLANGQGSPDYVSVVPVTTRIDTETQLCLRLSPEDGVSRESLAKVGMIQPVLKSDLTTCVGHLTSEALNAVIAQLFFNVGAFEEQEQNEVGQAQVQAAAVGANSEEETK